MVGIRKKILIPIIIINIFMCITLQLSIYSHVSKSFIEQGGSEAMSVAKLTSSLLDGDVIAEIAQTQRIGDDYYKVYATLEDVQKHTGADYVYIIGESDNALRYIFVTTGDEEDYFDEIETEYAGEVTPVLEGEEYFTDEIDQSEYGNSSQPIRHFVIPKVMS